MLALLVLLQTDPAEAFFSRVKIADRPAFGPVQERIHKIIRDREHWISAYRAVEATLGPWPAETTVTATFDYRGDQLAKARGPAKAGEVSFNIDRLEEMQIKLDELEKMRIELEKQKKKVVYKVQPFRLDRLLHHELTHVWQDGRQAPDWFLEGMAQHVGKDDNLMAIFARSGLDLPAIEGPYREKADVYVRGQLFWAWLDTKGAVKSTARAFAVDGKAWKVAVEESLKLDWSFVVIAENAWSQAEIAKVRERVK